MRTAASLLPVLLRFPAAVGRQDSWGRLVALTAGGARLSTATRLAAGEEALLSFELDGERFDDVRARVERAENDADGHRLAELRFVDEAQRRRLAKVLTDVLARS